ncbi:MAG TPA: hypothetical protein VGR49_03935 [Actinomycetota bacterium]|nr:hypothetical protein [Actinomycetota bacterium]
MRRPSVEIVLAAILAVVVGGAAAVRFTSDREPGGDLSTTLDLFGASFSAGLCVGLAGGGSEGAREVPDTSTVDGVARELEDIRELSFRELPEPRYLSPAQMSAEVAASFEEDYPTEEAEDDERTLAMLGAIPPDTDLKATLSGLVGEQVAGFYDPDTGDLVVLGSGGQLDPVKKVTLAHELDHALTNQALGIPLEESPPPGEEDAALAVRALAEGDATLAMSMFAGQSLSYQEQLSMNFSSFPDQGSVTEIAHVPHYLARTMLFPYLEGLLFVCELQVEGGWDAVDAAYREPPTTSAQILFPERYEAGEGAVDPRDPGRLPAPWTRSDVSALGAADLLFLFEAPGGNPAAALDDPLERAAAWAGGEMHLWRRGEDSALGVALAQRHGEPPLCDAVARWYGAAFVGRGGGPRAGEKLALDGEAQDAVLRCAGSEVRLGIGPDLATARALAR